jgi:3'-phosphoadenosine 5'-phosphosulfate sulfotransferase (PAPS reductase)/FAD synthetase
MKSLQEEVGLKLNDFGFKAQSAKSLFPDRDLSIFGVVPTNKEEEFEKYQNKGGSRERAEDGEEREDTTVAEMETFVTSFQGKQEYLRKMSVIDYMNTFDKILLGFSGGKDSLANLIFCLEHFPKEKIVPYFSNLGIGVDWTHSAVYIKAMERKYNIKIHNIGTPDIYTQGGFYDDLLQYGYPSPVSCWVRNKIKLPHVKAFQMQYKNRDDNFCVSLAVRWAESENRAKTYPDRGMLKDGNMFFAAPIVSWSETDIVKYLADHDCKLPTAYQHGERSGCICCPSEDKKTTITLRKKYPLLWKQILEFHARGARRTGGKLALPHMKKMVASIKDLELVEQERFCGSFSSLALSPIEFENYIEEEMGGKLPCENYMGIPYDPKFHIFKDDLRNTIPKKSEGIENIFTQSEIGGDNGGK